MLPQTHSGPRFGSEVRTTAMLAAPLVLGHVSTGLIGFVDSVIAGHHGTATLAAVAVGTALFWLPMMVPMGTLMSLPPSVSQLDGAGRRGEIGPLFRQALWLALALGLLMFAFLSLVPYALAPFGIAPDIMPGARGFLHGIRWGVPALTLYFCDALPQRRPALDAADDAARLRRAAAAGAAGLRADFRPLGLPELGAGGLGLASAVMMWAQAMAFALYLWRAPRFADLHLFARFDRRMRGRSALLAPACRSA